MSVTAERIEKRGSLLIDQAHQVVYGVVLSPGVEDSQGDIVEADQIEKAAHAWLIESRKHDVQHTETTAGPRGQPIAEVVESFVAPCDMQIAGQAVLKGAWVLGTHINDPATWDDVVSGRRTGFSIGGTGVREPISNTPTVTTAKGNAMSISTITKTSDVSPAGRAAIRRAIAELRPYDDNDLVAGLMSKMNEIATAPPVSKAAQELETVLKAAEGMSPSDRARVGVATREEQLAYLRSMSPAGAAASELGQPVSERVYRAEQPISLIGKAEQIRKATPVLTPYQAMERAMSENPDLVPRVPDAAA